MIFFGQEFGMGLAGWFSLGVSHALVVRCQLGHGLLKVHRAYMCIQDGGSQGFWLMPGAQLRLQTRAPTRDFFAGAKCSQGPPCRNKELSYTI